MGLTGSTGNNGNNGSPGTAATISVGTTTTLAPSTPASVVNVGSSSVATFNFGIPQGVAGADGATGSPGTAATISIGTTTTLAPASPATVTNSGSSSAAVFNFGIPQGVAGSNGTNAAAGVLAHIFYDECNFTAGGALTITNSGSYYNNQQMYQASAFSSAIGVFNCPFVIQPGTYTLYIYATKASNGGQYNFSFDGGTQQTFEDYASGLTNGIYSLGSFTISGGTSHTLNVFCSGKNASSTNYGGFFYKFVLK